MPHIAACSTMLFRWPAGAAGLGSTVRATSPATATGRSYWVPQYSRCLGWCHQPRKNGPPQLAG